MKMPAAPKNAADLVPLIAADVFQLAGGFRRWGNVIARRADQTQARWQVLSAASVDDRTVPQLARRLGIARQSVQRIADLLVREKLAEFSPNRDNERSPFLKLTRPGRTVLSSLNAFSTAFHKDLAEGLSLEDLENAHLVLRKFCFQIERDRALERDGAPLY